MALAAVSGGATVEVELAYGVGELADLVRAALRVTDPLSALSPIGEDAVRAGWADTVRLLDLKQNAKLWQLGREYLGAVEWSPAQVESILAGARAMERGDAPAAAAHFEQLIQSGLPARGCRGVRGGVRRVAAKEARHAVTAAVRDRGATRQAYRAQSGRPGAGEHPIHQVRE